MMSGINVQKAEAQLGNSARIVAVMRNIINPIHCTQDNIDDKQSLLLVYLVYLLNSAPSCIAVERENTANATPNHVRPSELVHRAAMVLAATHQQYKKLVVNPCKLAAKIGRINRMTIDGTVNWYE